MHTQWFAVLSMFVAVNTVLYLTLAIIKLLPKAYLERLGPPTQPACGEPQHLPGLQRRGSAVTRVV